MKDFSAPRLPLYKIGVPHYQTHGIIMMGTMLRFCLEGKKKKSSKFKRKHFSEMSDAIFYYPSICFRENLFTFAQEQNVVKLPYEESERVYMNDNEE